MIEGPPTHEDNEEMVNPIEEGAELYSDEKREEIVASEQEALKEAEATLEELMTAAGHESGETLESTRALIQEVEEYIEELKAFLEDANEIYLTK